MEAKTNRLSLLEFRQFFNSGSRNIPPVPFAVDDIHGAQALLKLAHLVVFDNTDPPLPPPAPNSGHPSVPASNSVHHPALDSPCLVVAQWSSRRKRSVLNAAGNHVEPVVSGEGMEPEPPMIDTSSIPSPPPQFLSSSSRSRSPLSHSSSHPPHLFSFSSSSSTPLPFSSQPFVSLPGKEPMIAITPRSTNNCLSTCDGPNYEHGRKQAVTGVSIRDRVMEDRQESRNGVFIMIPPVVSSKQKHIDKKEEIRILKEKQKKIAVQNEILREECEKCRIYYQKLKEKNNALKELKANLMSEVDTEVEVDSDTDLDLTLHL